MMEMKEFYETRCRPLETPEFSEWFDTWYAKESDFDKHDCLRDGYLSERRFALLGWLARTNPTIRNGEDFAQILMDQNDG